MLTTMQNFLFLIIVLLLAAACSPASGGEVGPTDDSESGDESGVGEGEALQPLDDGSGTLNPDAAYFAEDAGISLEEANQRLAFQETIGDIQPQLMSDLPGTYGGLWVEHEPAYRIVIALTEGDEQSIRRYIDGKDWAAFVEVIIVDTTLEQLTRDQAAAGRAAQAINASVTTAVDIINNRVELFVGNPGLFQNDLADAGIDLPHSVVVSAFDAGGDPPDSNRGVLLEVTTADGRTIYLPKQAPTNVSMAALMEGTLLEVDGCLRISDDHYEDGFLVIWRNDADLRVGGDKIDVLNGHGQPVARVGDRLRAGGGAMESPIGYARLDESIPGMPIEGCPGPYWVAGELETLVEQLIPDIYFEPFSSGGEILVYFVHQSRPSPETEILSGQLQLDDEDCLRVDGYLVIWPPGFFLREEPLRIIDSSLKDIAQVGDPIQLSGSEKRSADYRYFENKVRCSGPYWGVKAVSVP